MEGEIFLNIAKNHAPTITAAVAVYRLATRGKGDDDDESEGNGGGGRGPQYSAFLPVSEWSKRRRRQ